MAQSGSVSAIATSFKPILTGASGPTRWSQPSSNKAPAATAWPVQAATTGTDAP